jgi:Ca2+-binding EF-hand superfamily protein
MNAHAASWWSPAALRLAMLGALASVAQAAAPEVALSGPEVQRLDWNTRALQAVDINGDGLVNTADLDILLANLNKPVPEKYPCADLNSDGMITILDVRQIVSINPLLARDTRIRRLLR